jgi:hypothetical protein
VLDTSIDTAGVSIATATRLADKPRQGGIYDPTAFAAGVPIWFHPLNNGRFLGVYSTWWANAVVGTAGPQAYTSYVQSVEPSWIEFDPVTGQHNPRAAIPSRLEGDRLITAAWSRGDYLFTIGTIDGTALLQLHRVSDTGEIILQGEETLQQVGTIEFAFGVWADDQFVNIVGLDTANQVHLMRKRWGRVGNNSDVNWQWEFKGERGWTREPGEIAGLTTPTGPLTSIGAVTYGTLKDREFLAVHQVDDAKVYVSRKVDPHWFPYATYEAGWVHLQPQLSINRLLLQEGLRSAIPVVTTDFIDTPDASQLLVKWNLLGWT